MDAKQLDDEIWGVRSQWWHDVFPHGCIRDIKDGVMGRHNFKDETLIKRQRVGWKMNAMGGKFKDEK
jgi:hypothetical protein